MGAFLRNGFAHVDNVNCYPRDQSNRMAAPVKVARQQTTPRNSPEPSEPCLRNLHQHTPELSGTFEPTYLHQHTPELSGTFRNLPSLPPEPTPAYTGTLRKIPEPSGTCLWNQHRFIAELSEPSGTCFRKLHQHTLEPSEIFRNLLELASPEPSATCLRNLHQHTPEPSGTFGTRLRNLHQHTPELSGTFRNLPPEPAPVTRTGTHRSLSGLKTPVAYAVGEKSTDPYLDLKTLGSWKPNSAFWWPPSPRHSRKFTVPSNVTIKTCKGPNKRH